MTLTARGIYRAKGTGSVWFKSGKWWAVTPKIHGKGGAVVGKFEYRSKALAALEEWRKAQ